jgi:hypothetical protein
MPTRSTTRNVLSRAKREHEGQPAGPSRAKRDTEALFAGRIHFPPDQMLVLVDVDGTLANLDHRLHWIKSGKKNWPRFFAEVSRDTPIEPIVKWVQNLKPEYTVCIVSGRPEDLTGHETEAWLRLHHIPFDYLFMRKGGDRRQDNFVKEDILHRLPKGQIAFIIDDREQVVQMWRRHGLSVYQVAPGDF